MAITRVSGFTALLRRHLGHAHLDPVDAGQGGHLAGDVAFYLGTEGAGGDGEGQVDDGHAAVKGDAAHHPQLHNVCPQLRVDHPAEGGLDVGGLGHDRAQSGSRGTLFKRCRGSLARR
jgi:hypothetical protein